MGEALGMGVGSSVPPPPYFFAQSLQEGEVRGGLRGRGGRVCGGLNTQAGDFGCGLGDFVGGGVVGGYADGGFAFAVALELAALGFFGKLELFEAFEFVEMFEEELGGAFAAVVAEPGGRSEEAVVGIVDDLGDGLFGFFFGIGFGEVVAGDLEAVEHDAGAAGIDLAGGHEAQDFADGVLDGAAVFKVGDGEAASGAG